MALDEKALTVVQGRKRKVEERTVRNDEEPRLLWDLLGDGEWQNSAALALEVREEEGWLFGVLGQSVAFARLNSDRRFSSNFSAYSSAVCPSIPGAAPLRVRRYASRIHSMSMWWDRLVSPTPGICLASSAIRCCFVETVRGLGVPPIFPSNGSMIRLSASLRWVPWSEFPSFRGTIRELRFPTAPPCVLRFLARPYQATS